MTISINTNMASVLAYRGLQAATNSLGKSMQRLASGVRINSAADDAGTLSVTTRMSAKIRSINVAKQNANEGVSLIDVAYSALEETSNAIQDIRDMAVEARSGTRTSAERTALQLDVNQLITEIQRIATETEYNNSNLLNGSFAAKKFQIGPNIGDTIAVTINAASLASIYMGANGVSVNVASATSASRTIGVMDSALDAVNTIRAQLSGIQSRFESIINTSGYAADAYTSAVSGMMDTDIAQESTNLAKQSIIQQAGISVLAQAKLQPQLFLKLLE
ncbi:MAG: flagellin FliC [Magnetococcales bacterium]|nr:flagellin FliC [Magnetococcales bacterium]